MEKSNGKKAKNKQRVVLQREGAGFQHQPKVPKADSLLNLFYSKFYLCHSRPLLSQPFAEACKRPTAE